MARYDGYELDENGDIIIDVTKTARPEMAGPRIDVTRMPEPAVDALTIDASRPGQPREYTRPFSRGMIFDERVVATPTGSNRIQAADRSLMSRGAGGLRIVDPGMPEGGFGMRDRAAGVSGDGRIVLSPEAIGELGKRQIMEEQAALALQGPLPKQNLIDVTRRDMQRVADMGFVPRGTDEMRMAQMRGTLKRGQQDWLERNRPRDMMQRLNTRDQIMAQAEASQMTPQIMVADGVMAGYDPISKKIVTDASGARAIAASKVKDDTIQGMSDDDLNNRLIQLKARQIGELDQMEQFMVQAKMKDGKPTKESEALKQQLQKSKWNPDMQPFLDQYQAEWNRRNGGKAPAQKTGAPASKWALK